MWELHVDLDARWRPPTSVGTRTRSTAGVCSGIRRPLETTQIGSTPRPVRVRTIGEVMWVKQSFNHPWLRMVLFIFIWPIYGTYFWWFRGWLMILLSTFAQNISWKKLKKLPVDCLFFCNLHWFYRRFTWEVRFLFGWNLNRNAPRLRGLTSSRPGGNHCVLAGVLYPYTKYPQFYSYISIVIPK